MKRGSLASVFARSGSLFDAVVDVAAMILLSATMIILAIETFGRYLFGQAPPWSEELARLVFVWGVWVGACLATREDTHLRVSFLVERFPKRVRVVLAFCRETCVALFLGFLIWKSGAILRSSATVAQGALPFSKLYNFLPVPVGAAVMIVYVLRLLARRAGLCARNADRT